MKCKNCNGSCLTFDTDTECNNCNDSSEIDLETENKHLRVELFKARQKCAKWKRKFQEEWKKNHGES